jgi:hypothetical protein
MRIFGEHLDLDLITRSLGVQPSNAHRVGEPDLIGQPFPHDLWQLDAPVNRVETLEKHLLSLSQLLEPGFDFLRSLKGQAQVRSFCGIISDSHEGSFCLSPGALGIFTSLGIDMELSLIFLCLDTEDASATITPNLPQDAEPEAESQSYRTEARASLEITGAASDLKEISEGLGLPPSDRLCRGDASPLVPSGDGCHWAFTCPLPVTDELDLHMKWLGEKLLTHSKPLRTLKPRTEMVVCCEFRTESDTGGVGISPKGLEACTEIGIPLDFSAALI